MKIFFFTIFSIWLISTKVMAEDLKRPSYPVYQIISDEFDSTIAKRKCIVEGKVTDNLIYLPAVKVETLSHKYSTITDNEGNYQFEISEKDSGIFAFHMSYGEIILKSYDFKSQHRVVINFNFPSKAGSEQHVRKPVIYLYSKNLVHASVSLSHPGMTFQYPACKNDTWHVRVDETGIKDENNNKSYPYLFWEATTNNLQFNSNHQNELVGFIVKTDTLVQFLESALNELGLNDKEQTDFITYWVPSMLIKKYALIQFLIDDDYNQNIAPLNVNPKPDSMRRIFMQFSLMNEVSQINFSIVKQNLPKFNRSGFTLIEWGGAEISLPQTLN